MIYTEGSISLEDSWNLDAEDRTILMESFEEFVKERILTVKGKITQEQM